MGMNPDTNRFEPLEEDKERFERIKQHIGKLEIMASDYHPNLFRPDGSPVPIHWSVFKIGELVMIKDYTFRVAYIGESNILFEPVKPDEPLKEE